jgi:hypothetical protein
MNRLLIVALIAATACGPPTPRRGDSSQAQPDPGLARDAGAAAPRCDDNLFNGSETDLDCGGECQKCAVDQGCVSGHDCLSRACSAARCVEPSCDDGVQNGDEDGLDCGGSCDQICVRGCLDASDCASAVCIDGTCREPSCSDGVHNGDERAIDCGASCDAPCPAGTACSGRTDCISGICTRRVCEQDPVDACLSGPHADDDPYRAEACEVLRFINQDRALFPEESGNARPVRWDPNLYRVAKGHSIDMCERAFFDHRNPDGLGPTQRARALGFDLAVAENIALNQHPAGAMHAFMAEPTCTGHRGNILNPRNIRVGVGIHHCNNPDNRWNGYTLTTQNFLMDFSVAEAAFCADPQLACELPPNPVSTATAECPAQLREWGWCDYDPADIMAPRWNCPDD